MKIMTVGDLKTNFSDSLKEVQKGQEIAVSYIKKENSSFFDS